MKKYARALWSKLAKDEKDAVGEMYKEYKKAAEGAAPGAPSQLEDDA